MFLCIFFLNFIFVLLHVYSYLCCCTFFFLLSQDLQEFFSVFFAEQSNLSPGAIFGIIAGVLVAVAIIVVVVVCCFSSKKKMAAKCATETAVVEVVVE